MSCEVLYQRRHSNLAAGPPTMAANSGFFVLLLSALLLLLLLWNHLCQEERRSPFNLDDMTATSTFWKACYGIFLLFLLVFGLVLELKYKLRSEKIHTSALLCSARSSSTKLSILLGLSLIHSAASAPASILCGPISVNTTLCNMSITLTCVVEAEDIQFLIDNQNANEGIPGFTQSGVMTNGSTRTRNLNVQISLDISGSSIICRAFNLDVDPSVDSSNVSIVMVEGPLDPPTMIVYNVINSSALYISWTPPPTLVGTSIEGFNVSSSTGDSVFTSKNSVILNIFNKPDSCNPLNVTITAYNCIDGEPAILTGIYLPSLPSSSLTEDILVYYRPVRRVLKEISRRILIEVDVSVLCPSEIPTGITVTVFSSMNSSAVANYSFDLIPSCDSTLRTSSGTIELNDEGHCVYVKFMNQLGDYNISSVISIDSCSCGQSLEENIVMMPISSKTELTIAATPAITAAITTMLESSTLLTPTEKEEEMQCSRNDLVAVIVVLTVIFFVILIGGGTVIVILFVRKLLKSRKESEVEVMVDPKKDLKIQSTEIQLM